MSRSRTFGLPVVAAFLTLSACATARMHTQVQLNDVAVGCGLALGELIQDEAEKRVLIALRHEPSHAQRVCVTQWAKRNHLKPVFLSMEFPEGGS